MRNTIYYAVTIFFLTMEKCFAWRYSDEIDDDYDYEKPSNSISDFIKGLITYFGFFSFYFTVRNVIVFITRGKFATFAEVTPFFTWGILFYFYPDILFKAMFAWGGMSIFIIFCEGYRPFQFIGWCIGGVGVIISLIKGSIPLMIALGIAAIIIYLGRRTKGAFINFLMRSTDEVVEMRDNNK